jgi:transcriptional regulator with XRE-family HTH domain
MKNCINCKSTEREVTEVPVSMSLPFRSSSGERGERTFDGTVMGGRCKACGDLVYDGPDLALFERLVALQLLQLGVSTGAEARFLRKKAGLKALELAGILGVTPETISHWETGKTQPSPSELAMILQLARAELEKDEGARKLLEPAPTARELLERVRTPLGREKIHIPRPPAHAA